MTTTRAALRLGLILAVGLASIIVSKETFAHHRSPEPLLSPDTVPTVAPEKKMWTGEDVVSAFPQPGMMPVSVEIFRDPSGAGSVFPSYYCLGESLGARTPSSLGPYVTVDYQGPNAQVSINLSRYAQDEQDRASQVVAEAPRDCDDKFGYDSQYEIRTQSNTLHRLDPPPYLTSASLLYQRRTALRTNPDDFSVVGSEYTAYSKGWFLTVTADQDDADVILPVVLPALDQELGTAFHRNIDGTPGQLRGAALIASLGDAGCRPDPELKGPVLELSRPIEWLDVNGDSFLDGIVVASCTSPTARNPEFVRIFDGSSPRTAPRLMASLFDGGEPYLRDTIIRMEGRQMVVEARALSSSAALCCPDMRFSQRVSWNGTMPEPGTAVVTRER